MTSGWTTVSNAFDLRMLVADIFGDLAFLIAEDEPGAANGPSGWLHGNVTYRGPFAGRLECWTTPVFARSLVMNMLGVDATEEPAAGTSEDALRELLNVLCGNLVTRRYGRDSVFDLGMPEVAVVTQTPPKFQSDDPLACLVYVDGEPFHCRVSDVV